MLPSKYLSLPNVLDFPTFVTLILVDTYLFISTHFFRTFSVMSYPLTRLFSYGVQYRNLSTTRNKEWTIWSRTPMKFYGEKWPGQHLEEIMSTTVIIPYLKEFSEQIRRISLEFLNCLHFLKLSQEREVEMFKNLEYIEMQRFEKNRLNT